MDAERALDAQQSDAPPAETAAAAASSSTAAAEIDESQVRVDGLNKFASKKDVVHRLEKNIGCVGITKIRKQNNQDFAFVYFQSPAARFAAEKLITGHVWKGVELRVVQAKPLEQDRFMKKRPREDADDGKDDYALRSAADVVTALHALPYSEQLVRKRKTLYDALIKLPTEMKHASKSLPEAQRFAFRKLPWLDANNIKENGGTVCPLSEVIPATLQHGYRNKCDFSFGLDANGLPCIGFQLGRIRDSGPVVGRINECPNVSDAMKYYVSRVQAFLLTSSLPPWDKVHHRGFWRQLLIRQAFNPPPPTADGSSTITTPSSTSLLLVFMISPASTTPEVLEQEKSRLLTALLAPHDTTTDSLPPPTTTTTTTTSQLSIALHSADGPGEGAEPTERNLTWLHGIPYIEERLLGLTYRVSASAFFQVNTPGAEQLCDLLKSLCNVGPDTVLLDVCCGTGTLGLSLANSVKRVIGIEICVPAVLDARANAERNGVKNATYIAGRAEETTRRLLESLTEAERSSLVAIVDPPRAGLHHEVCKALRACLPLNRLIFVACHAPSFVSNAVPLCRPTSTSFQGLPFVPTRAHALDLFPHTPHCELIVLMERGGEEAGPASAAEAVEEVEATTPIPLPSTFPVDRLAKGDREPAICRAVPVASGRCFGPFKEMALECNGPAREAIDRVCFEGGFTQSWSGEVSSGGYSLLTKIPVVILVKLMLGLPEECEKEVLSLRGAYGICIAPNQRTCMNVVVGRRPHGNGYVLDKFSLYYPDNSMVPSEWHTTGWDLLHGYSFRTAALTGTLNRGGLAGLRDGPACHDHGLVIDRDSAYEDCAYMGVREGESKEDRMRRIEGMVTVMEEVYGGSLLALSYDPEEKARGVTVLRSEWELLKRQLSLQPSAGGGGGGSSSVDAM